MPVTKKRVAKRGDVIEYKLVTAMVHKVSDYVAFTKEVNDLLEKGYVLHFGPVTTHCDDHNDLVQALILVQQEDDKDVTVGTTIKK